MALEKTGLLVGFVIFQTLGSAKVFHISIFRPVIVLANGGCVNPAITSITSLKLALVFF